MNNRRICHCCVMLPREAHCPVCDGAAPAEDVRAVVEEPVYQSRFHWNDIWLDVDKATFEARSTDPNTYVTRALFSYPQRPVVLPQRADASFGSSDAQDGWNACMDAVEELNK